MNVCRVCEGGERRLAKDMKKISLAENMSELVTGLAMYILLTAMSTLAQHSLCTHP